MAERFDIAIIGGGIMGFALACELSRLDYGRIVVVERKHPGYGATSRNIGRVRTSQFSEDLAVFAKAAFEKHQRLGDELGCNTLFWRPGYALVFYDAEEMEHIDRICATLKRLDLTPELHRGAAVLDRLPILRGGRTPVGCLVRPDAAVHHDSLIFGYLRQARTAGVEIRGDCEVMGFIKSGSAIAGVVTTQGDVDAPAVVNAAGGWSSHISQLAGLRVPNVPLRREVLVTESARPLMDTMITFYRPIEGWFHQTLRGEVVMGAVTPDEPSGPNMQSSTEHLKRTARHILAAAPALGALRVVRQWGGLYDVTPDRKPMLGPVAQLPGFIQANGDNGRGIALIPYIAELLAQWIVSGKQPTSLAAFDANRYHGREDTAVVVGDYYAAYKSAAKG
ncbi:MAG: FAD-binding oxidoreductase [Hyphomicrobiaceae bacterium]|nr:FAD-binding oxidoreductase [Hyphomicrobiaceae bacterium]